ncbi:branchpoint-bridging protein-like isoform X2 [Pseudomyrmex gracilis]|uniref:branchpoint-bridging protein-like isoform X2 n=1 Tax=Pseudomyrmex gracilis TaxID=219809 RepID=UPI000995564B|nr:branchpoint-bridging protein-like isoform X2 [Pseudomyrmex gracilis]
MRIIPWFEAKQTDIMEECNGNCGFICDDSDEEDDSSPTNSPVIPRRIVPSPPLPPRRPSPSPTPNNHLRNGRHLTVPKENAPPPPAVIFNYADNNLQSSKEARYDMLHRATSPVPPIPPAPSTAIVRSSHVRRPHGNHASTPQRQPQPPPTLPEKTYRAIATSSMTSQTTGETSNNVPPVPPPLSAPRPPKTLKDARQDHHYENTIVICGTGQHVVKNINLEANRARFTALMKARDDPGGGGAITKSSESAAYENINVEHITKLTALGFTQDNVIKALGITRNDLEMACDILHEFAPKSS